METLIDQYVKRNDLYYFINCHTREQLENLFTAYMHESLSANELIIMFVQYQKMKLVLT